jgi:DNA replication protein DnaC
LARLHLSRDPPAQRQAPRIVRTLAEIDPNLRQAIRQLVAGELAWPLFLCGPCGVGKTCAALCLLDHAGGEYHTVRGLCDLLIQAQQGRLEWSREGRGGILWPEKLWARLAGAPLVVLDELGGRERVSDHHYEAVKTLVDERHGKPFVVLSNLPLSAIAGLYDDRLFSRLGAGTVVALEGEDRRIT